MPNIYLKFYFVGKISISQLPKKVDNFIPESFWTIYLSRYQQFYFHINIRGIGDDNLRIIYLSELTIFDLPCNSVVFSGPERVHRNKIQLLVGSAVA